MKRDLYTEVSARIIAELEKGAAPWVKPWRPIAGSNVPQNAATGRPYSGCNVVLLWMACAGRGWSSPRFLTFKQALEAGGNVRKGEHGTKVYFVKQLAVKKPNATDDDDVRHIPMLREYTVFHVSQCDNLPERVVIGRGAPKTTNERDTEAEEFVAATGADFREGAGGDRAFYTSGGDFIAMPTFAAFKSSDNYYATAFHELVHWSGAKHRLDREFGKRFGDRAYAAEELVAELGAAFLCAEFGFAGDLRHAGYIADWIRLLKDDPRAIFTAASKAQAAADYMRGLAIAAPAPADEPAELAA